MVFLKPLRELSEDERNEFRMYRHISDKIRKIRQHLDRLGYNENTNKNFVSNAVIILLSRLKMYIKMREEYTEANTKYYKLYKAYIKNKNI